MKKIIILTSIFVSILVVYLYICIKKDINNPCSIGRDTVYQVGENCRYAILSGDRNNKKEWSLFDRKDSPISIRDDIIAYYDENNYLYLLTSDIYIKIDYKNENIYYYKLNELDNNDKKIFDDLKNKEKGHYKGEI